MRSGSVGYRLDCNLKIAYFVEHDSAGLNRQSRDQRSGMTMFRNPVGTYQPKPALTSINMISGSESSWVKSDDWTGGVPLVPCFTGGSFPYGTVLVRRTKELKDGEEISI